MKREHVHLSEVIGGGLATHTPTQSAGGWVQGHSWVHQLQSLQYRTDETPTMKSVSLLAHGLPTFRQKGPVRLSGKKKEDVRANAEESRLRSHSPSPSQSARGPPSCR